MSTPGAAVQRHVTRFFAIAVIGAVLTLVPDAAGASAAANSNCKYLKASEVSRAIGTKVKKGPKPPGPASAQGCGYIPKASTLRQAVNVWVVKDSSAAIAFSVAKSTFKTSITAKGFLGKKSFFVGGNLNTAYVLKGSTLVFLQWVDLQGDAATIKAAVIKLTKLVVRRV
jgi:hypothetical protein